MNMGAYRANSADDLLNALPALFGFVPRESIIGVCLAADGSKCGFRLRHDLPDHGGESKLARLLAFHLLRNAPTGFLVVAVSANRTRAKRMALALRDALPGGSCEEVLWADRHRVWTDSGRPGSPGLPYSIREDHEVRARAVMSGLVILADRSELRDEVVRPAGAPAAELDEICEHAIETMAAQFARVSTQQALTAAVEVVNRILVRAEREVNLTDLEQIELGLYAALIPVRDELLLRIGRENAQQMHQLWASVSRLLRPELALAALCLTAFSAWQAGDGARALTALDRAREISADYSLIQVLADLLAAGTHPDSWARFRRSA